VHAAALLFLTGGRQDDNRAARAISDLGGCRAKTQSREAKLATRTDNKHFSITRGVDKLLYREAVHDGHLQCGRLGVTMLAHHLRDGILGRRTSLLQHYRVLRHDGMTA
jgi:hypothetical protein